MGRLHCVLLTLFFFFFFAFVQGQDYAILLEIKASLDGLDAGTSRRLFWQPTSKLIDSVPLEWPVDGSCPSNLLTCDWPVRAHMVFCFVHSFLGCGSCGRVIGLYDCILLVHY